jgi:uncharacterized protein YecE (DUF72 family)
VSRFCRIRTGVAASDRDSAETRSHRANPPARDRRSIGHVPTRGRLYAGTSGFSYPSWVGGFYAMGTRSGELLRAYAEYFNAVELNNTFYQFPTEAKIAAWRSATPEPFRFTAKAQQRVTHWARLADPVQTRRQADAMRLFGDRLGSTLVRVPDTFVRDDARLGTFLDAWPPDLPVAFDLRHPSWLDDEVLALVAAHGNAAWAATDRDELPEPARIFVTGPFLYVRLRRTTYSDADLGAWVDRVSPFIDDGRDVFVFFRHTDAPTAPQLALRFAELASGGVAALPDLRVEPVG